MPSDNGDPIVVGASGYVNLSAEFVRKVRIMIPERAIERHVENIQSLMRAGYTKDEAIAELMENPKRPPEKRKIQFQLPAPYIYNQELFLDDCKRLVRSIAAQANNSPISIRLLVGILAGRTARLHEIDASGSEAEIDFYTAIGSGEPFVKVLFERFYKKDQPIERSVRLAILAIRYVEKIGKEESVGYTYENPPDIFGIFNGSNGSPGKVGPLGFENQIEVLKSIDEQIGKLSKDISEAEKGLDDIRGLSF